jgi:hypothetical protein
VVISSVVDAGSGRTKVAWSDAQGTSARGVGTFVTIPTGLITSGSGDSVIMAEVTYTYTSAVGQTIYGNLNFTDVFYSHPRQTQTVTRSAS